MPRPNASAEVTQRWFADNSLASVMIGVCQLLSVACLGGFAVSLRQGAATARQVHAARKATPWGLLAVACMALSSLLGWLLTAFAADASLGTVAALRTASFIAGGTAHVVALGIFVLLVSRIPDSASLSGFSPSSLPCQRSRRWYRWRGSKARR
jgi:hypothetical protein